jgi:hypothetical protein
MYSFSYVLLLHFLLMGLIALQQVIFPQVFAQSSQNSAGLDTKELEAG